MNIKKFINPNFIVPFVLLVPMINGNLAELLVSYGFGTLSTFVYPILFLLSLYLYGLLLTKKPIVLVVFFLVSLIIFGYSFLLNNEFTNYLFDFSLSNYESIATSHFFVIFILSAPLLLIFFTRVDVMTIQRYFYKIGVFNLIIFIWAFIQINLINHNTFNYLTIAYSTLPSIFICYYVAKRNKNLLVIALAMIASILIMIGGSRGSLVSLIAFYIIEFVLSFKMLTIKYVLNSIIVIAFGIIAIVSINTILSQINNILGGLGYSSRIIDSIFFFDGGLLDYTTRIEIQNKLFGSINILGNGLFADRVISGGSYSHNWILEIIVSFGVLFGIPILIYLFSILYIAFKSSRKHNGEGMFFIIYAITMLTTKFFVSATFLQNAEFWFLFGVLYHLANKYKYHVESVGYLSSNTIKMNHLNG